jgi:hypothetical protein
MTRKWITRKALTTALIGTGALAIGGGTALAIGGGDDDPPLAASTLEEATAAALESTGGGTVVDSEAGDGGEAYEVEVRLEDGRQVEISLNQTFEVLGTEADHDGSGDDDGPGDD